VPKPWVRGSNRTLLGLASGHVASTALANSMSAGELMDRHSVFPILSSFLDTERAAQCKARLTSGELNPIELPLSLKGLARSNSLRQCPACVSSDVVSHGVGHWRRLHQIPSIRFCTHHDLLLHNRCGNCNAPFTTASQTLPGEPCAQCGSVRTATDLPSDKSPGYSALADLLERALIGEAPELSHSVHARLLSRYHKARDREDGSPMFGVLDWWETEDIFGLFRLLQSSASQMNAHSLFSFGDTRDCFLLTATFVSYICTQMPELLDEAHHLSTVR